MTVTYIVLFPGSMPNAELETVTCSTELDPEYEPVTPIFTSLTNTRYVPASLAENVADTSWDTILLLEDTGETVGETESRLMAADTEPSVGSELSTQTVTRLEPSERVSEVTVETTSEFTEDTVPTSEAVPLPQAAFAPA